MKKLLTILFILLSTVSASAMEIIVTDKDGNNYKGISTQQDDMIWDKNDKTDVESRIPFSPKKFMDRPQTILSVCEKTVC